MTPPGPPNASGPAPQIRSSRGSDGRTFLALVCFCVSILGPLGALAEWRSYQIHLEAARRYGWEQVVPTTGVPDPMMAVALRAAHWHLGECVACVGATALLIGLGIWLTRATLPPEYPSVDWKATPRPARTLVVRASRWQITLYSAFLLLTGGLAVTMLAERGLTTNAIYILIVNGVLHGVLVTKLYRAMRQAVAEFDAAGVLRRDGQRFGWEDFQGVLMRTSLNPRIRRRYVWRTELAFRGGARAWVIPQHVRNLDEVFDYLSLLPVARLDGAEPSFPAPVPGRSR